MTQPFVPQSALERAIADGDAKQVMSLLSAVSAEERAAARPSVRRVLKAMDAAQFARDPEKKNLWVSAVTREQSEAAGIAAAFCGSADDIATHLADVNVLIEIGSMHRPPGFAGLGDAILERSLHLIHRVQALIAAGLVERPSSDAYFSSLMGLARLTMRGPSLEEFLAADPGLKQALLRMLETEGTSEFNLAAVDKYTSDEHAWSRRFCDFAASGFYPRGVLHEKALAALERDWPQFRAGWFSRFHEALAPTLEEMRPFRNRYLALTRSRIPPTVTFALDVLTKLDADQPFAASEWSEALAPVMSSSVKAQVIAALKQMDRVVKREPSKQSQFAAIAAVGLTHAVAEVHKAVLERLQRWGVNDSLRGTLASYAPGVAAVHRSALEKLIGEPGTTRPTTDASQPEPPRAAGPTSPLDPARRIAEIRDTDELIDRLTYVFECDHDVDEFERVLAALVRLGPIADTLRPAFGPVLKRAPKVQTKPLPRELINVLHFLLEGIRSNPGLWVDTNRGILSRGEPFLSTRVEALLDLAAKGRGLTPLAAPTHRRGFIDPLECVTRLELHAQSGIQPSLIESVQALLRLAPGSHDAALTRARAVIDWPITRALRYALGDDIAPAGHEALFAAAARIRCPNADDPRLLAAQGDLGPDAARSARYRWYVLVEQRGSYTASNLRIEPEPAGRAVPVEFVAVARHRAATEDWRHYRASQFGGPGPGLVAWSATVVPSSVDALFAEGIEVIGNNLDWSSAEWWSHAYLHPLLDPTVPLNDPAALLLGLALCAKEPGQAAIGVDALAQSWRENRYSPRVSGMLRELLASEWIKASRLANSLRAALRIEPSLASTVFELLAEAIQARPRDPPKDTAKLLDLLQETLLTSGRSLPDTTIAALSSMKLGSQGGRIVKELLGLNGR
jgi:Family of unknown function (DUF6493)